MNKKGFTLLELLAVIAILAVLAIIAIPNILKLFTSAKEETFVDETKHVYQTVEKQLLIDIMKQNNDESYYSSLEGKGSKLDLSGEKLDYCIVYNKNNKITYLHISNNSYSILKSDPNGIDITSIDQIDAKYSKVIDCNSIVENINNDVKIDDDTNNNIPEDNSLYKRLEYIESVAEDKQYFDTEYKYKNNTRIIVDGMVISGDTALYGARNGMRLDQRYTLQYIAGDQYRLSYRRTNYYIDIAYLSNIRHTWKVSNKELLIDDENPSLLNENNNVTTNKLLSNLTSGVNSQENIYLMCINDAEKGGAINFGQVRIYSFKIYEDDTLIKDFIPVLDKKNVACLYDLVEEKFYYNKSGGTFIYRLLK